MKENIKYALLKLNLLNIIYYKNNISHIFLKYKKRDVNEIVICGMPRSGSTLVYNIVKELIGVEQDFVYVNDDREYLDAISKGYKLIKCHSNIPIIKYRVKNNKAIGIFTYRNLLDVAVSFIQKKRNSKEEIIKKNILRRISYVSLDLARTKNINKISYENNIQNLTSLIDKLSKITNCKIDESGKNQLLKKFSRNNVNSLKHSVKSPEDFMLNKETGFHENHFFDGKMNKYLDTFNQNEIAQLSVQIKHFNSYFNYQIKYV
jgi:hypothetical protein